MFIEEIDAQNEELNHDSLIHDENYEYSINDLVLVRTTDYLPNNEVIETPDNALAVVREFPEGFKYILMDMLENLPEEVKMQTLENFKVYERVKRQTLHFCVNGLVSSHMYGNFDDRNVKIIEPLKYHINSNDLIGLRSEDTYFKGNVNLSNEAVLLLKSDYYEIIKSDPNYMDELSKYKIFTYKGHNEVYAVNEVLNKLGYDSFIINNHGYTNGLDSNTNAEKMYSFINKYATEHNINQERHFYSDIKMEDLDRQTREGINVTSRIVDEMTMALNKDDEYKKYMHDMIEKSNYNQSYNEKLLSDLITEYGLENLAILIGRINAEILSEIRDEKVGKSL